MGVRCAPSAERIGVVVTGRGRTATSEGVSQSDTVYMLTYFKGKEMLTSVPPTLSSLTETDKLNPEVIAMERLMRVVPYWSHFQIGILLVTTSLVLQT